MIALAKPRRGAGLGLTDKQRRLPSRDASGRVLVEVGVCDLPTDRIGSFFDDLRDLGATLARHRAASTAAATTTTKKTRAAKATSA